MIESIIKTLKALTIETWLITETVDESAELFFIRQKEDIRRAKNVRSALVSVFEDFEVDGKRMRGGSSVHVFPGMNEDEIATKLREASAAAKHVKNPWFELCDPVVEAKPYDGALKDLSVARAAEIMAEALFTPDRAEDAFINSAEIFSERKSARIVSSRGTDVKYEIRLVKGEFVTQCISPVDVEMYFDFEYAEPDTFALSDLAAEALKSVRDRASAEKAPASGSYDLVLSGRHLYTILSAYLEKSDAAMIFAKYSPYAIGTKVQGEDVKGEKLNMTVVPSEPYSADGIPMPERTLIEDGKLVTIAGATRFCRYLGIEPIGSYERMRVQNGEKSFEELKKAPCLWPVAFSDFQMDAMTGHFGGEIRLAYLIDENGVVPVTGGSVNGSLLDKQGELYFSTERYKDSRYDGPLAVRIPNVSVAG